MKANRFHPILLATAICLSTGTSFGQGPMSRPGNNRSNGGDMNGNQRTQTQDSRIRSTLSGAGYTDPNLQQQVVTLARQQQAASQSLLPQINALRSALLASQNNANGFNRNINNSTANTTNANSVADLFADYRSAVADVKTARADAIDQLDKNISFSTDPVLEALLTMLGIVGDETGFVSNLAGQAQLPGSSNGGRGAANTGGMDNGQSGMNNNRGNTGGGMNGGFGGMGSFGSNGGMGGGPGGGMMPPPPPNGN